MRLRSILLAVVIALAAPGAAFAQSGRAEASAQAPAGALKSQLINEMFNRGFMIVSDSPYLVVFDKINNGFAATLFFGTPYGGSPHVRVSVSFAELGATTRMVADISLIGNAGTAFERRTDLNSGADASELQQLLYNVAARAAPAPESPTAEYKPVVLELKQRLEAAPPAANTTGAGEFSPP